METGQSFHNLIDIVIDGSIYLLMYVMLVTEFMHIISAEYQQFVIERFVVVKKGQG